MNFAKFLRTLLLTEHLRATLLTCAGECRAKILEKKRVTTLAFKLKALAIDNKFDLGVDIVKENAHL